MRRGAVWVVAATAALLLVVACGETNKPVSKSASSMQTAETADSVELHVAFLPTTDPRAPRVAVVRDPADQGIPIILLRSAHPRADDLQAGIEEAVRSLRRDGVAPVTPFAIRVEQETKAESSTPRMLQLFEALRETRLSELERDVPGLGAMTMQRIRVLPTS